MPKNARTDAEPRPSVEIRGLQVWQGYLDQTAQKALVEDIRRIVMAAPLFRPITPSGRKMSVRMTSAGRFGWVSDRGGYRYAGLHPAGKAWPPIPSSVQAIWQHLSGTERAADCCLVNFYGEDARMGLHQDRDEADFSQPVLSISLGDDALFRVGNTTRGGKTESIWLKSGDVVRIGGEARLAYHGIDRVRHGSSELLRDGGRLNLTLRVVT